MCANADLSEQLRVIVKLGNVLQADAPTLSASADEIERLRAGLEYIAGGLSGDWVGDHYCEVAAMVLRGEPVPNG